MEHCVYYFTGTGNSLAVARRLSRKAGAELIPVKKAVRETAVPGGMIGVVFPVYMFNAPKIVYEFMGKIKSCDYLYIVMTMAGESGKTSRRIRNIVSANGIRLDACFSVIMPDNYIVWSNPQPIGKRQEIQSTMEQRLDGIVETVTARNTHLDNEKELKATGSAAPFPFNILPDRVNQLFMDTGFRFISKLDRSFNSTGTCNGCGICSKICPVDNIVMTDGKPVWQHRCEQCFACLQWCPHEAIEYRKNTVGRIRYHHPEVTVKDMMG
ncbi:MAG: EFR1 family ferrodoxin [Chitinispirillaceae bacterium]|nr:EFR1 family ferrodoxin [Chitinispirillaceae bacterium]